MSAPLRVLLVTESFPPVCGGTISVVSSTDGSTPILAGVMMPTCGA